MPTWFAYAILRRVATLEAVISLPTRPFPAPAAARPVPSSVQSAPEDVPGVAAGAERRG